MPESPVMTFSALTPPAPRLLVIPDALSHKTDSGGFALHTALAKTSLPRLPRSWTLCDNRTPLEWLTVLQQQHHYPAAWLAALAGELPEDVVQCWVVSPYSALLMRDWLYVPPADQLVLNEVEIEAVAELFNPLLPEVGMLLIRTGRSLLAVSNRVWEVFPASFASVAGAALPNQHPRGRDGGALMRLQVEIQMYLASKRAKLPSGCAGLSGLWFWGATAWPLPEPPKISRPVYAPTLPRTSGGERVTILYASEVEVASLPRFVLLAGHGAAALVDRHSFPRPQRPWLPEKVQPLTKLLELAGV